MSGVKSIDIEVVGNPVEIGEQFTVDIEVENAHSYLVASGGTKTHPNNTFICSHNSVSLLAGSTPGVHFPIAPYYIRRVRLMNKSELLPALREAGFNIEPCIGSEKSTVVVEFPIALEEGIRTTSEVSIWEKVQLASFLQKWWADNQVSVTVDFDPDTESNQIKHVLEYCQYNLKAVSLLPRREGVYKQMPYEAITKEQYEAAASKLKPLVFKSIKRTEVEKETDMFCDGDKCVLVAK